jgi:hypothetical protein
MDLCSLPVKFDRAERRPMQVSNICWIPYKGEAAWMGMYTQWCDNAKMVNCCQNGIQSLISGSNIFKHRLITWSTSFRREPLRFETSTVVFLSRNTSTRIDANAPWHHVVPQGYHMIIACMNKTKPIRATRVMLLRGLV